jgi:hypothetical protein
MRDNNVLGQVRIFYHLLQMIKKDTKRNHL